MTKAQRANYRPFFVVAASAGLYLLWNVASTTLNTKQPLNMAEHTTITVLSLSQNRPLVQGIHKHISPHGFNIGGILGSATFSESELKVVLRSIEPRPQVLLVGRNYTEEETAIADRVFTEYKKEVGIKEGHLIKITSEIFEKVGGEGMSQWVLGQLKSIFNKK